VKLDGIERSNPYKSWALRAPSLPEDGLGRDRSNGLSVPVCAKTGEERSEETGLNCEIRSRTRKW
jgi:hypothetical protein